MSVLAPALRALVRRLGAPQLALRLQQSEVCLSMGALAALNPSTFITPLGVGDRGGGSSSSAGAVASSDVRLLVAKATSVAPFCTPLELSWISAAMPGLAAGGEESAMAVALLQRCLALVGEAGTKIRLEVAASVVKAALRLSPVAASSASTVAICDALERLLPQDPAKVPTSALTQALEAALLVAAQCPSVEADAVRQRAVAPFVALLLRRVAAGGTPLHDLIACATALSALADFPPCGGAQLPAHDTQQLVAAVASAGLAHPECSAEEHRALFSELQHCAASHGGPSAAPCTLDPRGGDSANTAVDPVVAAAILRLRIARGAVGDGSFVDPPRDAVLVRALCCNAGTLATHCDGALAAALFGLFADSGDTAVQLLGSGAVTEEVLEAFPGIVAGAVLRDGGGLSPRVMALLRALPALDELGFDDAAGALALAPDATIASIVSSLRHAAPPLGTAPRSRRLLLCRLRALVGHLNVGGGDQAVSLALAAMAATSPDECAGLGLAAAQVVMHHLRATARSAVDDVATLTELLTALDRLRLRHDVAFLSALCGVLLEVASDGSQAAGGRRELVSVAALATAASRFPALNTAHAALLEKVKRLSAALPGDSGPESSSPSDQLVAEALPAAALRKAMAGEPIDDQDLIALAESGMWGDDDVAKVVAALAYARHDPTTLAQALVPRGPSLAVESVVTLLRATAAAPKLRNCRPLYIALVCRATAHLEESDEQIDALLPAFAALQPSGAVGTDAMRVGRRRTLAQAAEEQRLLQAAANRLVNNLEYISTTSLCDCLAALAALEDTPLGLLGLAAKALAARAPCMKFAEVTATISAMAAHDMADEPLVDALLRRVQSAYLPTSAPVTLSFNREAVEEPPAEEIVAFLRACGQLDAPEFDTLRGVEARRMASRIDSCDAAQLVAVLLALAPASALDMAVSGAAEVAARACQRLAATAADELPAALLGDAADAVSAHQLPLESAAPALRTLAVRAAELIGGGTAVKGPHLVALLRAIACYGPRDVEQRLGSNEAVDIQEWLTELVEMLTPSEMVALAKAMFTLDVARRSLVHNIFVSFAHHVAQYTPRQVCDLVFYLGQLFRSPEEVQLQELEAIVDHCVDHADGFNHGPSIVRLLAGFSKLMLTTNRNPYVIFATRLRKRPILESLQRRDVTLALSAFGAAKFLDQALFAALAQRAVKLAREFGVADVCLTVGGYSGVYLLNDALYDAMASRAAELAPEFTAQQASHLLRGYASLQIANDDMCEALLNSLADTRPEGVDPRTAAQMLLSLCKMDYADANHYGFLAEAICRDPEQLTPSDIGGVCDVLRHTNWREDNLLQAIGDQAVRLATTTQLDAEIARNVMDTLGTFLVHHAGARLHLSPLARTVSREALPDGDDPAGGTTAAALGM